MKLKIKIIISLLLIAFPVVSSKAQELNDYLKIAAENNPELQSAYTSFEAALQQSPQVASLPDPTLTLSAFGRMVETRLGAQEARFSFMQMFPWFGTLKTKRDAANLLAEARFQEYLAKRANLFFEVKKAYAELFAIQQSILLKEKNLDILDSYRELSLSKFRSGSSKMVDVVRVDIKRDEALTEIAIEEEQLESLKRRFNLLLNRNKEASVGIQDTLVLDAQLQPDLMNTEQTFNEHPELAKFDKEREAYEHRAKTAQKSGLPNIGIGLDYAIISERTDMNPPGNGQDVIMPMVSVTLPIFRKKYKAAEKEAVLMQEAAIKNKEATKNQLQSDLEAALYDLVKAKKQLNLYKRQIESSVQANKLLVSAFSNDDGDFEEILEMNQDILLFKIQQLEALKTGFTAEAKMEYLSAKTQNYDETK